MYIPVIFKNLGPGRFFGHGRIMGVHLRDSSDLGKATDPYINVRTLARLSKSVDPVIRSAAINNLAAKLKVGFDPQLLEKFKPEVIIEAMVEAKEIAPLFIDPLQAEQKQKPQPILYKMITDASPIRLEKLARSHCLMVKTTVAGTRDTPDETLLRMAMEEDNLAGEYAFTTLKLKGSLTRTKLHSLSDSQNPKVLCGIIEHEDTSRETIIKLATAGKSYEYAGRTADVGRMAYKKIKQTGVMADELRSIAHTPDWWILFDALALPQFPHDLKLKMVVRSNARVAEEAWKNLDKRSLTVDDLRALQQKTRSGLARIEIEKILFPKSFW